MRVRALLDGGPLESGLVVAGHEGLERDLNWVHVVELPEPWRWIDKNQFLLTTGFSWTKDEDDHRKRIRDLNRRGVAGVALAVPSYLKHFPAAAKEEADRVGLPLIEIPWEIPFSRISETINREIIHEQQLFLEHSISIHRSLTRSAIEAESLEEIIEALSSLIGRSVVLEGAEGAILAVHTLADDPLPVEANESPVAVRRLLAASDWSRIRDSHQAAIAFWNSGGHSGSVVISPVWLKDEFVGSIWMPSEGNLSEPMGLRAAEHASTVIALHIARERNVITVEQRLKLTLIDSLLEGQFADDAIGIERAILMGIDPYGDFQVVLFSLPETLPLNRDAYLRREYFSERIARRMKQLHLPALITSALNEVHVVLQGTVEVGRLTNRLDFDGARVCVGRKFKGVTGVHQSYCEAKSILKWAKPGVVNTFNELLLPRLLDGDHEARKLFIEKWLAPFESIPHGNIYLQTLEAYTKSGFNQRIASEALSVHPKTMHYRTSRIAQMMGTDLTSPEIRFQLQLLFQIIAN